MAPSSIRASALRSLPLSHFWTEVDPRLFPTVPGLQADYRDAGQPASVIDYREPTPDEVCANSCLLVYVKIVLTTLYAVPWRRQS